MSTFPEWFANHRLRLLRFSSNLCGDGQLAQDLVQEVSIRAHSRWVELQRVDHPEAYLRRMVVNEFLSWRRKWSRIIPVGNLTDLRFGVAADHAAEVADRQQLRRELNRLPRRQRAVLVLRYYEGLDDSSIAELLGTRQVTVRAYASRALARLRIQILEDPDADQPTSAARRSSSPVPGASHAH